MDSSYVPPQFLSRDRQLYLRTLTHVLKELGPLVGTGDRGQIIKDESVEARQNRSWRTATSITQIMIRTNEVIAVMPGPLSANNLTIRIARSYGGGTGDTTMEEIVDMVVAGNTNTK